MMTKDQMRAHAMRHGGACRQCDGEHEHHVSTEPTRCYNCGDDDVDDPLYLNIEVGRIVVTSPDGFTYCYHGCCDQDHEPRASAAAERLAAMMGGPVDAGDDQQVMA